MSGRQAPNERLSRSEPPGSIRSNGIGGAAPSWLTIARHRLRCRHEGESVTGSDGRCRASSGTSAAACHRGLDEFVDQRDGGDEAVRAQAAAEPNGVSSLPSEDEVLAAPMYPQRASSRTRRNDDGRSCRGSTTGNAQLMRQARMGPIDPELEAQQATDVITPSEAHAGRFVVAGRCGSAAYLADGRAAPCVET